MISKDEFCRQIRIYEQAMYSLAFSVLKNDTDVGEVISEAIYRAYKNLDTLKNIEVFKCWILKIVHNTAVDYIRKRSKILFLDEANLVSDMCETSLVTKISLKDALNRLKQPYRTVIILFYYEDLSISQISKIIATPTANVKQRLARARKQLKEILKEDFIDE